MMVLMADHLSKAGRSRNMAAIRSKDTRPELALRAALRAAGVTGYRIHRRDIPGRPDIAFLRWRVAVFVDGVFWHGHPNHFDPEKAASEYWRRKIARNVERDRRADIQLAEGGWRVVRVWDLDVRDHLDMCVSQVVQALRHAGRTFPERGVTKVEGSHQRTPPIAESRK
jgi:DNA mismatch endonuclease, patch repair protein